MAIATRTSVTEVVAEFAVGDPFATAPDELYARATRAFIDTIGVAIAARGEPAFTILERTAKSGHGDATVLATRTKTTAQNAALLNGTAGHALDYDDVADEIKGHPSVVLVSALLALAEVHGASGHKLLKAYAVGFEVACAIAAALPVDPHYSRGWHATATVGILGAAAGAGHLLGLDQEQLQNALGIAASMASGSRQNFGTMTKPLHAGLAARDAVLAVELAAAGFTADPHQLEGPVGYFRQYGIEPRPASVIDRLDRPMVLLEHGLNVKKYACCYGTHRMADAALALHGIDVSAIEAVHITVEPNGTQAIIHHRPTTGLQGKFSGEYVVAACLLDGAVRLNTFTDEAVCRPSAQDLLRHVTIEEAAQPERAFATVEVHRKDGSVLRERCDIPRGDARKPLTDAELQSKFRDCLSFAGMADEADDLLGRLQRLRRAENARSLFA